LRSGRRVDNLPNFLLAKLYRAAVLPIHRALLRHHTSPLFHKCTLAYLIS